MLNVECFFINMFLFMFLFAKFYLGMANDEKATLY